MESPMTIRSLATSASVIALCLIGAAISGVSGEAARGQTAPLTIPATQHAAPNFAGISNWFNSAPFNMAEFPFERSASNVQAALKRHGITYPVAQDNESRTWNAYRNQYWPAQYIVDQSGKIVFQHGGEGQYEQRGRTIARLLNASS